jgi:thiosulfate/3-mercaptopyruvate sulfurtransferase
MSSEYANPAALVSTQWVADHLNDPNVRLLEVDVDTSAYGQGHVDGAVGINWTTQLGDPIRRDIPTREAWAKLLGDAGVSNDTRLIFYGDNNNWFAAFAYWVSKIYGHQNAALMNGGRKKWELENRPLTTSEPSGSAASYSAEPAPTCRCAPSSATCSSGRRASPWWMCAVQRSSTARSSRRPA